MPILRNLTPATLIRLVVIGVFVALVILSTKHEVINQYNNAFWTLFCLCVHPALFWLIFLLIRWSPRDIWILRNQFCKNGTEKPNERASMAFVILLYQIGCFGQYASCILLWVFTEANRPSTLSTILNITTIVAGVGGKLFLQHGPLGRGNDEGSGEANTGRRVMLVRKDGARMAEEKPEWQGGLFDLMDDPKVACLSFSCPCCVFGWTMGRIYLGNTYCQTVTFFLFCTAPLLVFNMAAIHFHNHALKLSFLITSIVFCILGLIYGAAWRIKMRRLYNLPVNNAYCGNPDVADGLQWLFCCCCSLAQESRTVDVYEVIVKDGNPPPGNDLNGNWQPPQNGNSQPTPTAPSYYQDTGVFQGVGDGLKAPASANMQRGQY